MSDPEAIRRLLLDCGFRDAPWPPRGARRFSLVGRPVPPAPYEIVISCVAEKDAFHLRASPPAACKWVEDVLDENGVTGVNVRADSDGKGVQARGPWMAVTVGIGAIVLFALSLW